MRIISGKFKSRHLKGTPPAGIRPTSDKLRETLFNILGARVDGATFLDGCAGVGAIGLEAISRGAALVYFVDQSRKACQMIRQNLASLEIKEGFKIMEMDLTRALGILDTPFDIAFIDPPYDYQDVYADVLQRFGASPRLSAEGLLILEHSKRKDLPESSGTLRKIRSLVQGDAALAFYSSLGES
jgi:16S rRNA (guanine(966)-N(2))-methyltransferase RsmD